MRESSSRLATPAGAAREEPAGDSFHDHPVVHAVSIGFALAFSWLAGKFFSESAMSSEHYGWISGTNLLRVFAVAFDLYVVGSLANSLLDALRRPLAETHHRLAFVAGCVVLAFGLHFTGMIGKAYKALGLAPPGPAASIGMLRSPTLHEANPETPLEAFAGDWRPRYKTPPAVGSQRSTGWASRLQIGIANGEARIHLWRACPAGECDGGTHLAIPESRHRGSVLALHLTGNTEGVDWLLTLYWRQNGDMQLEERERRGIELKDYRHARGHSDVLERQK